MTDELTVNGLTIDDFETRLSRIKSALRASISANLDLTQQQPMGQLVYHFTEHAQQLAELLEEIHSSFDPNNASGQQLSDRSLLSGIERIQETKGTVSLDLTFSAAGTAYAGDKYSVAGEPDNVWVLDENVVAAGAGTETGSATAENAGEIQALAGTITTIVTPRANLTGVTNPSDATPGFDTETDIALRLRREKSFAVAGSSDLEAILTAVRAVTGVQNAVIYENSNNVPTNGLSPKSFEVVYWDGTGSPSNALKDLIATAIYTKKPIGIEAFGTEYRQIEDSVGSTHQIGITLATQKVVQLEYTLTTDDDYEGDTAFKAAIAEWDDSNLDIGEDVFFSRFVWIGMQQPGIVNLSLRLRFSGGAWGTSDLSVLTKEIATIATTGITVI